MTEGKESEKKGEEIRKDRDKGERERERERERDIREIALKKINGKTDRNGREKLVQNGRGGQRKVDLCA